MVDSTRFDSSSIELERLEYGKVCVAPDGPIESGAEHGQLGWSEGFPEELIEDCVPAVIGITDRSAYAEPTPSDCPHGTILRPAVIGGRARSVLARVGKRQENPGASGGRTYVIARYLVAPEGSAAPLALFAAMHKSPLQGLKRAECEIPLARLRATFSGKVEISSNAEAFLARAVIYAMSGVPVGFSRPIAEDRFFRWANALWHLLPPTLRPLFSAGWGVGGSISGALAMAYAESYVNCVALFDPKEQTWEPPREAVASARTSPTPFHEDGLIPGKMYAFYAFEWPKGASEPDVSSLHIAPKLLALIESPPPCAHPRWPRFTDAEVVQAFRWPGRKALDDFRMGQVERWVAEGGEPSEALDHLRQLDFAETRQAVLRAAAEGLSDMERRGRSEALLIAMLSADADRQARVLLAEMKGPGAPRAHLIAAVVENDPAAVLNALLELAAEGDGGALDEALATRLRKHLDAYPPFYDSDALSGHLRLLASPSPPPREYLIWFGRHAVRFAPELVKLNGGGVAEIARLEEAAPDPNIRLLRRLSELTAPDEEDLRAAQALSEDDRATLSELILKTWIGSGEADADRPDDGLWVWKWSPLRLRASTVQRHIVWLCDGERSKKLRWLARVLWAWALGSTGEARAESPSAVDLCKALGSSLGWPSAPRVDESQLTLFLMIARAAENVHDLRSGCERLWSTAGHGWQVRLLLELFPYKDFQPTLRQLQSLIVHRKWLKFHLEAQGLHRKRRERFEIASLEFHSIPYSSETWRQWDKKGWLDAFWMVFKGVPVSEQRTLNAMSSYSATDAEGAELCTRYLDAHKNMADFPQALERILCFFVLPRLREHLSPSEIENLFKSLANPDGWRSFSVTPIERGDKHLQIELRSHEIAVSRWMLNLLEHMVTRGSLSYAKDTLRRWWS